MRYRCQTHPEKRAFVTFVTKQFGRLGWPGGPTVQSIYRAREMMWKNDKCMGDGTATPWCGIPFTLSNFKCNLDMKDATYVTLILLPL